MNTPRDNAQQDSERRWMAEARREHLARFAVPAEPIAEAVTVEVAADQGGES